MHPDTVKRIKAMIEFIKEYQVEFGTSPSAAEIAKHIQRSEHMASLLLGKAQAMGLIRRKHGARRCIEVVE